MSVLVAAWPSWIGTHVVLINHFLHPIDCLSIKRFGNGDVAHGGRSRRAMPVFLARRKPYDVTREDLLLGAALDLYPAQARVTMSV